MSANRILVVDDEPPLCELLTWHFEQQGYEVACFGSAESALQGLAAFKPDLVVLDRQLPDGDGLLLCRLIKQKTSLPVIMLTAMGSVDDTVHGLQSGADDYLRKPFSIKELLARVEAMLRRAAANSADVLTVGDLAMDRRKRTVTLRGEEILLSTHEMALLELLMSRPHQVFTREQILTAVWNYDYSGRPGAVEACVRGLRARLGDRTRQRVRSIRGVGYTLGS